MTDTGYCVNELDKFIEVVNQTCTHEITKFYTCAEGAGTTAELLACRNERKSMKRCMKYVGKPDWMTINVVNSTRYKPEEAWKLESDDK